MPGLSSVTVVDQRPSADRHPALEVRAAPGRPLLVGSFLGGCRITLDGRTVDTESSRRTRGLLTYILTHRRAAVPRDVLMDVFWPAATPDAARNNLHVALTRVRQVLRDAGWGGLVERRYDTYAVSPQVDAWLDVDQFERACADARRATAAGDHAGTETALQLACQLYAGDFLAADPYLEWALPVRERMRREWVEAQRALMAVYVQRGEHGPASVLGRAVLAVDPADEVVHRGLMVCLAANGQRHLALEQYQRLARTLWRTFRVGPSAHTSALYEALRRPDPYRSPVWRMSTSST